MERERDEKRRHDERRQAVIRVATTQSGSQQHHLVDQAVGHRHEHTDPGGVVAGTRPAVELPAGARDRRVVVPRVGGGAAGHEHLHLHGPCQMLSALQPPQRPAAGSALRLGFLRRGRHPVDRPKRLQSGQQLQRLGHDAHRMWLSHGGERYVTSLARP